MKAAVSFVYVNHFSLKVNVRSGQCKEFAFSEPSPVKDFKAQIRKNLVLYALPKSKVFLQSPVLHFLRPAFSDTARLSAGVGVQVIIPSGIVDNSYQLVVDGFQIRFRIILLGINQRILPSADIGCLDFINCLVAKEGKYLVFIYMLLRLYGGKFQSVGHVLQIKSTGFGMSYPGYLTAFPETPVHRRGLPFSWQSPISISACCYPASPCNRTWQTICRIFCL